MRIKFSYSSLIAPFPGVITDNSAELGASDKDYFEIVEGLKERDEIIKESD